MSCDHIAEVFSTQKDFAKIAAECREAIRNILAREFHYTKEDIEVLASLTPEKQPKFIREILLLKVPISLEVIGAIFLLWHENDIIANDSLLLKISQKISLPKIHDPSS